MPKYAIISQVPYSGKEASLQGKTFFDVILLTDQGYQERQKFIGDLTTVTDAAKHLQTEYSALKQKEADALDPNKQPAEPVFIDVV